jgi:hypothetical protein
MARIQVYERRVAQDGGASIARLSGADPIGAALQNIGQAGERAAGAIVQKELLTQEQALRDQEVARREREKAQRDAEELDKAQVPNLLATGQVYWQQREDERFQAWKVGDPDMREQIGKDVDKWVEESTKGMNTPAGKRYFQEHAARIKARLQTDAYSYQRRAAAEKLNAENVVGEDNDEILVTQSWRNPKAVNEIIARRVEPLLVRSDIGEGEKIKQAQRIRQRMLLARERAFVENDPGTWLRENGFATSRKGEPGAMRFGDVWKALIQQESGGRQSAVSPKGAVGVAQVMPDTAPEAARLAGLPFDEQRYRNDAAYNEALGRAYFEKQLSDFGGDYAKALAAYNGGPGRLRKALADAGPGGDWLSKMPAETRNYVAAITKAAGPGDPSPAAEEPPSGRLSATAAQLDPDAVRTLRGNAETRVAQQSSLARAEGVRLVGDLMAAHKDGRIEAAPLGMDYFDQTFGANGARAYAEYRQSREMGRDIASFRAAPAQEIQAAVAAATPEVGQGYAAADARQQTMRQAAVAVLRQREADPVTYAAATSPAVQRLTQQVAQAQDPQERKRANERLVEASLAEQQRLGIQAPRILSPAIADRWQAQAMKAARPEDSANLIAALQMEYGDYFSRVFSELAREGKLSGELLIIPNLPAQAAREAVSRLARVKDADLAASVPSDQQRAVKDRAQEAVVDLVRTVPFMGEQAVGMVSSYEQMIRKMAYEQVGQGSSPDEAVERARKMLLGHYEFRDTLRIPRGVDYRSVRSGLKDVLGAALSDIDVPPDLAGARAPDQARKAFTEIVRSRPLWHTADDDSGVRLFVVRDDGVKMPVTKGGRPLMFTWEQLQAAQQQAAQQTSQQIRSSLQFGPALTGTAPGDQPSLYASEEEWAAYRQRQSARASSK